MSSRKLALIAAVTIAASGAAGASNTLTPPVVPTEIAVGAEYRLFMWGHAVGTQNYICGPAATSAGVDWHFIGPQATVFDADGEQIFTHFQNKNPEQGNAFQATWQHSRDTSAVWAKRLYGSTDPAYVSPDAIEWLLLEVTGARVGPDGGDKVSGALRIHRVNTVGGLKPPLSECTPAVFNTRRMIDYEADYYFYR